MDKDKLKKSFDQLIEKIGDSATEVFGELLGDQMAEKFAKVISDAKLCPQCKVSLRESAKRSAAS